MDRHSGNGRGRGLALHVASRLRGIRRLALATSSRFTNCRFVFALSALAVLGAKLVHVYTHLSALATVHMVRWGYSFFAQDTLLLIILRLLLDGWLFSPRSSGILRWIASCVASLFIGIVIFLNIINICFFVVSGSEIHWRNVGLAGDAAGRALLLSGLVSSVLVIGALILLSWLLQDVLYAAWGLLMDVVSWPVVPGARARLCRTKFQFSTTEYTEIPQGDIESAAKSEEQEKQYGARSVLVDRIKSWPWARIWHYVSYALAAVALLAHVILCALRPDDNSLLFMSWTPALLPFVDFKTSTSNLDKVIVHNTTSIYQGWEDKTALRDPIPLSWLPKDSIAGFEDWYQNKKHYSAEADPLRISNLDDKLLPELKDLKDVPIRHIMAIVLESTRKDVFPIKNWGINPARLRDSWDEHEFPPEALERLKTLTPTAKYITGDYKDEFERPQGENNGTGRGGINFNDAYTTSTYTLKSLAGSLCGVMPMMADFNLEYLHHIYQPCLPHIAAALNTLEHTANGGHAFGGYNWTSTFMQSVTLSYDNFGGLMKKIGFPEDGLIDKDYLQSEAAKFGRINLPDVNYFGFEETPLEDYIRDQFETAKKTNGRAFITHVTSTSHHPYSMPKSEEYVPLGKGLDDLSHYINAIGYDDRWLGKILGFLDDLGVANETLVIFVGDHGLSIPENDILASYYNPNKANNHVPLVFSHPKLPPITINDAISTQSILPTVLDLLIETGSLSGSATQAVKDLLHNYEGQSLLRPVRKSKEAQPTSGLHSSPEELANWQFTNINPGRAMLGVRDARHQYWRMVVPVVDNVEWRFTDIKNDHREAHPIVGFNFEEFQKQVAEQHGDEAATWVEKGAYVARWFVEENSKRWRYGPYEP